jgi:hypothetical protein
VMRNSPFSSLTVNADMTFETHSIRSSGFGKN